METLFHIAAVAGALALLVALLELAFWIGRVRSRRALAAQPRRAEAPADAERARAE